VYRYYICRKVQRQGWKTCPTKSVCAADIEEFVLDRVKAMGKDPSLRAEVVASIQAQTASGLASLRGEKGLLDSQFKRRKDEIRCLIASIASDSTSASSAAIRIGELERENATAEERLVAAGAQIATLESSEVDAGAVATALGAFDPVWEALWPLERVRILQLVVKRATYDGEAGTISLELHNTGIATLAGELKAAEEAHREKKE
jgi:site-specific DNA recombinase